MKIGITEHESVFYRISATFCKKSKNYLNKFIHTKFVSLKISLYSIEYLDTKF